MPSLIPPDPIIRRNPRRIPHRLLAAALAAALGVGLPGGMGLRVAADMRDRDPVSHITARPSSPAQAPSAMEQQADQAEVMAQARQALTEAVAGTNVRVKNKGTVSYQTLGALEQLARSYKKNFTLSADTPSPSGNSVQGRLYLPVNPDHLTGSGMVGLGVYTQESQTRFVREHFHKYFHNQVAVVYLTHTGSFGGRVQAAAKPSLSELDTDKLRLYTYNMSANTYREITDSDHFFDKKDYLHFHTTVGGYIVITDRPLSAK